MAKKRGTSSAPIVLGIVGGVLGLPASLCSGVCAATFDAAGNTGGLEEFYLYGCAIISVFLIIVACFTKKAPKVAGSLMLIGTAAGIIMFGCSFNLLGIIAMLITLIGAILSFVQKREVIE